MAKNRLYKILSRVAEVKPGEEVIVLLLFFYFFLTTAPYTVIKSLRNASLLDRLSEDRLPLAYFLTALLTGFIVALHSKFQVKLPRRLLIVSTLSIFFLTGCLFWFLFRFNWGWVPVAFWVWANIFVVVLVTQFWITVNDFFNPREAKRLIGFFGSGGILGGLFGGELAGLLAKSPAADFLLLMASAMLIMDAAVVRYLFFLKGKSQTAADPPTEKRRSVPKEPSPVGFRDSFKIVKTNAYLKLLAGVVIITLVVSTLIDFQFNSVVDATVSGKSNLIAFFGHFNAGIMVLAFIIQLFMTGSLIRSYGVRVALLVYPLILLLCSGGMAALASASIILAVTIKGSDKTLSFSLNQSVRELLYIPVSPELKYKSKPFIDMFLNRFAKGVGAVILTVLVAVSSESFELKLVAFVSLLLILVWIGLNVRVGKEYAATVKEKLELKWERADKLLKERMDVDYAKLVFDTLASKERSSVLYALHLFDLIKQNKLTPELRKLFAQKSDELAASSLGGLLEDGEFALGPEIDDEIEEEVLKKEVSEIMTLDVYHEVMKDYAERAFHEQSEKGETARMELAKAIGLMSPESPLVQKLGELINDESPEVSRYALESAAKLKRKENVDAIIRKLESPFTHEDAASALAKFGAKITGTLADYLGDLEESLDARKPLALVLARIGTQEAADGLSWALAGGEEALEADLLDALDRIRAEKPKLRFSETPIKVALGANLKKYCQAAVEVYDSKQNPEARERAVILEKAQSERLSNIFKLLGLIYPREDMVKAYQNIHAGTKESVAYAFELLDNVLQKELRDVLLPLVEDISPEEKIKRCRHYLESPPEI